MSDRVRNIHKSSIHETTRLPKEIEVVAFLSWARLTADTPEHIKEAAMQQPSESEGKTLVPGLVAPCLFQGISRSSRGTEPENAQNEKRTEMAPRVTSVRPSASSDNNVTPRQKLEAGGIEC